MYDELERSPSVPRARSWALSEALRRQPLASFVLLRRPDFWQRAFLAVVFVKPSRRCTFPFDEHCIEENVVADCLALLQWHMFVRKKLTCKKIVSTTRKNELFHSYFT